MFDGRTNLSIQVADEVKKFFGSKVYKTIIPRNVDLVKRQVMGSRLSYMIQNLKVRMYILN